MIILLYIFFYDVKPNQRIMKTKMFFVLLLTATSFCAQAQSIYVRAGLGAAICTSPQINYQYTDITEGGTQHTVEAKRGGLGNGLPIFLAAGYYFSDNFGVELGVDYFNGFNSKKVDNDNGVTSTYKEHGSMLAIVPAFVMKLNQDKFKPYARLGIMIGVLNSEKYVLAMSNNSRAYTSKDYGGIAIGAQAALGADIPLGDMFSVFGEVNLDAISWAPKKGKFTKHSSNGTDDLANLTTKDKTWVYEKSYDKAQHIADSEPNKVALTNYSFANVGLVVGVKINIGK